MLYFSGVTQSEKVTNCVPHWLVCLHSSRFISLRVFVLVEMLVTVRLWYEFLFFNREKLRMREPVSFWRENKITVVL